MSATDTPQVVAEAMRFAAVAIIDGQHGGMFTCIEAERFYEALTFLGMTEEAELFMRDHAEHDDDNCDLHKPVGVDGWERR